MARGTAAYLADRVRARGIPVHEIDPGLGLRGRTYAVDGGQVCIEYHAGALERTVVHVLLHELAHALRVREFGSWRAYMGYYSGARALEEAHVEAAAALAGFALFGFDAYGAEFSARYRAHWLLEDSGPARCSNSGVGGIGMAPVKREAVLAVGASTDEDEALAARIVEFLL